MNQLPPLLRFAYVHWDARLPELVALAEKESWDYKYTSSAHQFPILHNYLLHTFTRVDEEKKIAYDDLQRPQQACFNTGLLTPNYEQIFAYFAPNNRFPRVPQKWELVGFLKESDHRLTQFRLPDMPRFFDDPAELVFNPDRDIRADIDHIIVDNQRRFLDCLKMRSTAPSSGAFMMASDEEPASNIAQDPGGMDDEVRNDLRHKLSSSIDDAKKRARRNFKIAVPQFFRPSGGQGHIQLLLPLYIRTKNRADLALTISHEGMAYVASTVLTLDMAYNNARLLARPDSEWLEP
ncbi:MAG TPA: DUF3825 domain-containing protein [Candidatus Cryosericum sp.]|nr:DUF3825 domain-containing protein [Candidatus Cryosericum sp.]